MAEERGSGAAVTVAFLQDAIDKKLPVASGIENTKQSRKGGSIHYGAGTCHIQAACACTHMFSGGICLTLDTGELAQPSWC